MFANGCLGRCVEIKRNTFGIVRLCTVYCSILLHTILELPFLFVKIL